MADGERDGAEISRNDVNLFINLEILIISLLFHTLYNTLPIKMYVRNSHSGIFVSPLNSDSSAKRAINYSTRRCCRLMISFPRTLGLAVSKLPPQGVC